MLLLSENTNADRIFLALDEDTDSAPATAITSPKDSYIAAPAATQLSDTSDSSSSSSPATAQNTTAAAASQTQTPRASALSRADSISSHSTSSGNLMQSLSNSSSAKRLLLHSARSLVVVASLKQGRASGREHVAVADLNDQNAIEIMHYVYQSNEDVVLDNAYASTRFCLPVAPDASSDSSSGSTHTSPTISPTASNHSNHPVRSVLCIPLPKKLCRSGVLYLENNSYEVRLSTCESHTCISCPQNTITCL